MFVKLNCAMFPMVIIRIYLQLYTGEGGADYTSTITSGSGMQFTLPFSLAFMNDCV